MLDAIKHGLTNLFNLNGRDARQAFWYYVLFVYLVTLAISMVVTVPLVLQSVLAGIHQGIAQGHGQNPAVAQAAVRAAAMGSVVRIMPAMVWMGVAVAIIMLVLLGASFVRRLHDSDLPAYWALIPAALEIIHLALLPSQLARVQDSMTRMQLGTPHPGLAMTQGSVGASAVLGWVAIGAVVLLGVRKSTPGPNRYGETPFTA